MGYTRWPTCSSFFLLVCKNRNGKDMDGSFNAEFRALSSKFLTYGPLLEIFCPGAVLRLGQSLTNSDCFKLGDATIIIITHR